MTNNTNEKDIKNANRVKRFDSKLKRSGGTILNGIRLNPTANISLFRLVTLTGLSRTEIVNRALIAFDREFENDNKTEK